MVLIITEKPSVAKDIAAVFESSKGEGCYNCKDNGIFNEDVVVTWAFGHLLKVANVMPKDITMEMLPIFPFFDYEPMAESKKQLTTIKHLLAKATKVVIATDSGREGELIARLILEYANWRNWSQTYRFWSSEALTPDVVKKTLGKLKPSRDYDGLYKSALGRQHSDWIVGLNLSVATSKTANGWYSIGRVQTPTLRLIKDRMDEIRNFLPVTYFTIDGYFSQNGMEYKGVVIQEEQDRILSLEEANEFIDKLKGFPGDIKSVSTENKETLSPPLHSLTSLQREANEKYSYSASDTLQLAQDLYEKLKVISYPRTDSNYMGESSIGLVEEKIQELGLECDLSVRSVGKRVFNDAKLTDHHAIIPLAKIPDTAEEKLRNIYYLIVRRFHGAFLNPLVEAKTEIITNVLDQEFLTRGTQCVSLGWKRLYKEDDSEKESSLPKVEAGHVDVLQVVPGKHITESPKKLTESTLLKAMEKLGLGTPATRAAIIEKILKQNYIERENGKKNLVTTDKGDQLIGLVSERKFSNPEMTAEMERKLADIASGKFTYDQFLQEIKLFTTSEIEVVSKMTFAQTAADGKKVTPAMAKLAKDLSKRHGVKVPAADFESTKAFIDEYLKKVVEVGQCKCGADIKDGPKSFYCPTCGTNVWKESYGRKFSKNEAAKLLNGESISVKGLKKKDSKDTYAAKLGLQEGKLKILEFIKS